mgnify:CR=1 FL=1
MKEVSKKKQWKFNRVVKDLHSPKYHQRIKQPKQKYDSEEESIKEGLDDYHLNKGESSTP